jgi:predicted ester cyclase
MGILEEADMGEPLVTAADVVRGFYESFNRKDLDVSWAQYISPGLVNHAMGGAYDSNAWREADKALLRGLPDLSLKILDQVAEGDKVATRWIVTGTHSAEFMGIPATGRTAALTATSVDRVQDGKIAEHWLEVDFTGFVQKLTEKE